jgi:hypothetical protein
LVKAEPLKVELEKFKADRLAEYLDRVKDAGNRRREVAIDEKAASVSERLNEVLSDEEMRELVKVYPLKKIAALVVDKLVKIKELAAWAAESLERLLRELARLFSGTNPVQIEAENPGFEVVEAEAPDAPEPASAADQEWFYLIQDQLRRHPDAPIGPELALFMANVEQGFAKESGLSAAQVSAGIDQTVVFADFGEARAQLQVVAGPVTAPSTSELDKTQDNEPEAPLSLDWDESRDPAGERLWNFQRDMDRHAQLSLLEEAHKVELAKLLVMEKVSWDKVEVTSRHFKTSEVLEVVRAGLPTAKRPQPEMDGPK